MKLVVGNFKMNLNQNEIADYIEFFKKEDYDNVVFAPSFIYLKEFVDNGFKTCSQDVSFAINGAYTGDISTSMLKSIGVTYSIIGHSERKEYFGETLEDFRMKIQNAMDNNIIPIYCISQNEDE